MGSDAWTVLLVGIVLLYVLLDDYAGAILSALKGNKDEETP